MTAAGLGRPNQIWVYDFVAAPAVEKQLSHVFDDRFLNGDPLRTLGVSISLESHRIRTIF